jgi:alpha-L-fucosidase 2
MDQMLCYESFVNFLHASKVLGIEDELTAKVEDVLKKLSRPKIGSDGRILEWGREDLVEKDPRHRHLSHLYSCYPGCEITPEGTPELAEAVMKSLAVRTTNHTRPHGMGFVRGHLLNLYARLRQTDHAYHIVRLMVKSNTMDSLFHNLGSNHILLDGQGAGTAGIAEMLLQSHGSEHVVRLLPALPNAWKDGSFSGLCARGGFDIDLNWKHGRPARASVLSKAGEVFRIKCTGVNDVTCAGKRIEIKRDADGLVSFETDRGKIYEIRFEVDSQ